MITPDQADQWAQTATDGPWYVHTDPDDPDETYIYDETGNMCIVADPAGSAYLAADLALAAAAPDLAQTIAGMRWEWRCEADFDGTWAGLTTWESSPDYARATMQRRHRYPVRLVRRLVGPGEVTE